MDYNLRRAVIWLAVGVVACYSCSLCLAHFLPQYDGFFTFFSMTSEFSVFLMGIVAFFLWRQLLELPVGEYGRRTWSACLMVALVLLYFGQLPFETSSLPGTSLLCAMLVLTLSLHPWPLLVNRVTIFMGRISYSIYILHFFIVYRIRQLMPALIARYPTLTQHAKLQTGIAFFGTLALTVPLAAITWRWVEEPGIQLGRWVIAKLENRRSALSAFAPITSEAGTSSADAQF